MKYTITLHGTYAYVYSGTFVVLALCCQPKMSSDYQDVPFFYVMQLSILSNIKFSSLNAYKLNYTKLYDLSSNIPILWLDL